MEAATEFMTPRCSAPNRTPGVVNRPYGRHHHQVQMGVEQAKAQIIVFVVQKKLFIEKPDVLETTHAQQHRRTADETHTGGSTGGGAPDTHRVCGHR